MEWINDNSPRPRVLLLAYACDPERGSEPGLGWNRAVETARRFETWVICEERDARPSIERFVERHGAVPRLHFVYVPRSAWEDRIRHLPGCYYLAYHRWQRRAFEVARSLHKRVRFDLVHHVNMCGFREPGYLWKLDAPFVWGPVGGTQNYPGRYLGWAGLGGAVREAVRNVLNVVQLRFSPRVRRAASRASLLMAANSTAERDFQRVLGLRTLRLLESGVGAVAAASRRDFTKSGPLRLLWSGMLEDRKALHLLLHALAGLPDSARFELRILGRGPRERAWRALCRRLGIADRCTWLNWQPRDEAVLQYSWADLLVFTSLRDTSGNVVLEALAAGTPVLCLDHQGVGDIVTPACGLKVPVTNPRQTVAAMRDAIQRTSLDRDSLERLSIGAIERAREYTWAAQGERMARLYWEVLGGQMSGPRADHESDRAAVPQEAIDLSMTEPV